MQTSVILCCKVVLPGIGSGKDVSPVIVVLVLILAAAGEVVTTMDTTTELSRTYEEVERLCEEVTKLGEFPLDPSKCEVTFPTAMTIMNKETSLMVTLRDVNGDIVDDKSSEVEVSVTTKTGEAIIVKDISGENYAVSFTPRTLGDHMISVVVDGQHIPGSPHK